MAIARPMPREGTEESGGVRHGLCRVRFEGVERAGHAASGRDACKDNGRLFGALRQRQQPASGFPFAGLGVEAAFAGHNSIRGVEPLLQAADARDDIEATFEAGAKECDKPSGKTAGGATSGQHGDLDPELAADDRGISREGCIEGIDMRGGCTLLGTVDCSCATRTNEWVRDVDGDDDFECFHDRWPLPMDGGETSEAGTAGGEGPPGIIEELCTEGACHSVAAIGRGAATDADDQSGREKIRSGGKQFANAKGVGSKRVALRGIDEDESVGCCRFNYHKRAGRGGNREDRSVQGAEKRIVHRHDVAFTAETRFERVDKAGTAIGHGEQVKFPRGTDVADSFRDGGGGLGRGEGAFELLWRNEDAHGGYQRSRMKMKSPSARIAIT